MPDNEVIDRGDNWTPTEDAAPEVKTEAKPEVKDAPAAEPAKGEGGLKDGATTDEPKTDEEGKTDDKPKKDSRIPAARHKEILDRERERREAVEAELAKYKQGAEIAAVGADITEAENTLVTLEQEYAKQLADGEVAKAAETMAKIRRTERSINEKNAQVREAAAEARAVERVRYDTTVERLEAQYPALNVEHPDFDKAKTAEVLELKEAYQLKGFTPSAALQKAVKLIMPPETKAQEKAVETEARVDAAAVEKARKAAAVEKTADAVGKTPANAAKVGLDSDKSGGGAVSAKDVMKMSFKDFSALDENTLAQMRGDVL